MPFKSQAKKPKLAKEFAMKTKNKVRKIKAPKIETEAAPVVEKKIPAKVGQNIDTTMARFPVRQRPWVDNVR